VSSGLSKAQIAAEVGRDLPDGSYVNLGIGLPTLVAEHLPADREIILHSENGILGMIPAAEGSPFDPDLINAGKLPVALRPGGCYVSHADSFAIIRGGHLDFAVMGAFQVSAGGDLANWATGEGIPGVGGAMDLVVGVSNVFVMMRHNTPAGAAKIVEELSLPVTGRGVVTRIYTELGIFELADRTLVVVGTAPGVDEAEIGARTGIPVRRAPQCLALPRSG
jgi:3-oxoadipate CoA-transferase beta subunit